ncbi:hypothetical protein Tco_0418674 [Tanacetum coccineum]
MTESTSVTEHVNNLNTLFSQLTSLSCKIEPHECVDILLQSLPDSYDQLIISLTSNVLSNYLVFDDVAAAILEEENRHNNREDMKTSSRQVEALVVTRGRSMEPGSSESHNHAEVPHTLEYKGGQLNAAHVLEVENFTNWKKRKPEGQWTANERKAANLDQRLKSLIMSILPDDQMNYVINCLTTKSTWDDLILYHKGPSDVKESRVMDLKLCYNTFKFKEGETLTQTFTRYKALMNELVNDGIKLSKLEINTGFIDGLPKKWLSFCQSLRNTNHVKDSELASLFVKLKYEENLIDNIYETEKNKSLVSATPLSTAFFSTSIIQDFQDSPDDEEDTRSSHEYLNDLKEEYQARALLAKSKRFFKKAKYNKVKAKLALLSSSASASKASMVKNKGLIAEAYEWDEEEVSSDDNEKVEVKTEIPKRIKNLRTELKELTTIIESWLNISNKVKQYVILRVDQLTEDPSNSGQKDPVFVISLADWTKKVSISGV